VAARAAQAADGAATRGLAAKHDQDALLDSLAARLEATAGRRAEAEQALAAHSLELATLKGGLQRTQQDLTAAHRLQKELLGAWAAAVAESARREDVFQAVRAAAGRMTEAGQGLDCELRGAARAADEESAQAEALTDHQLACEAAETALQAALAALQLKSRHVAQQRHQLSEQLGASEADTSAAAARIKALLAELSSVEADAHAAAQALAATRAEVLRALADSCSVERGSSRVAAAVQEARARQVDLSVAHMTAVQESARHAAAAAQAQAAGERSSAALADAEADLAALSQQLAQAEQELRHTHEAAERAARETEKLNRRLDALTSGQLVEDLGPLEATIANLIKEIATASSESRDMQRTWISLQQELVTLSATTAAAEERCAGLRGERGVLHGRSARLTGCADADMQEVSALGRIMEHGHVEAVRLATAASRAEAAARTAQEETHSAQGALEGALAPDEALAESLERKLEVFALEEQSAKAALAEAEAASESWERQIESERETAAALDPTVGGSAAVELRRELHRLTLRRANAVKRHERLCCDLGRVIEKRDTISVKGAAAAAAAANGKRLTRAERARAEMDKLVKDAQRDCGLVAARLEDMRRAAASLAPEAQAARDAVASQAGEAAIAQEALDALATENHCARARLTVLHAAVRCFDDMLAGRQPPAAPAPEDAARLAQARERLLAAADALLGASPPLTREAECIRAALLQR